MRSALLAALLLLAACTRSTEPSAPAPAAPVAPVVTATVPMVAALDGGADAGLQAATTDAGRASLVGHAEDGGGGCDEAAHKAPRCGGIAAMHCPEGLRCIDDPCDDCDVDRGGADCGGICVK